MNDPSLRIPSGLIEELAARIAHKIAPSGNPEPWLNVEQAAEHLACTRRRIYDLAEREAVVYHRDGKRLLFRRADLDAYVTTAEKHER